RYAFAPIELGQSALDLGIDGLFVFLQPDLAFALYFQRIEEHVFHTLERAATQPLLNERLDFRTFYFDGHGATLWHLFCPHPTAGLAFGQPEYSFVANTPCLSAAKGGALCSSTEAERAHPYSLESTRRPREATRGSALQDRRAVRDAGHDTAIRFSLGGFASFVRNS